MSASADERARGELNEHPTLDEGSQPIRIPLEGRIALGVGKQNAVPAHLNLEKQGFERAGERAIRSLDEKIGPALAVRHAAQVFVGRLLRPR